MGTVPKRVHKAKKTKKVKKKKNVKQARSKHTTGKSAGGAVTQDDNDLREEVSSLQERLLNLERAAAGRAEMIARLTGRARLLPTRRNIEKKIASRLRKAEAQSQAQAPRPQQHRAKK